MLFNGGSGPELHTERILKPKQTPIVQFAPFYDESALPLSSVLRNKAEIHMFDACK